MLNENDNLKDQVSSLKSTLSTARETFQSADLSEYLTTDSSRKIAKLTEENSKLAHKLDSMTE
jgi:predicted RNase H-like nuclease (RuvC/YqgF family)